MSNKTCENCRHWEFSYEHTFLSGHIRRAGICRITMRGRELQTVSLDVFYLQPDPLLIQTAVETVAESTCNEWTGKTP